ncbi:hypothetical protein BK133_13300 [Paenibacillus sp. FSL H8-0548]|uniref:hypothetical protein n=1 Tax=Paenibacillus sp. FSL H8-0548 TaxID=1920422 RepID=UPI00096D6C1C|nr:hypothetical protein [Paenibacillus sp. FSL H8-0548]OMF33762.1 hypothetical protein BK133_13300 [Paenibacillus sp. FSL H8-0548]
MLIKKKTDITFILENFNDLAQWDAIGNKYYFVFSDRKRGGQWTLMSYGEDRYSIHGLGEAYMDESEFFFEKESQIHSFLWENRSAFNAALKPSSMCS